MNEIETITGTVDRLLFQNTENGFTIFVLQLNKKETITVKGYMPCVNPGEQVSIVGTWIMHPKFGKQLEAKQCIAQIPTSIIGLKKYLGSGLIKGIGPIYAEKLINYFGVQILDVIDKTPEQLNQIRGIGQKRIATIVTAWQAQKEISHIMVFLQEKNISPAYATKIYKKYGAQAVSVIVENPYRLADEIWGIGFKTADMIAQNMGFAHNSLKRIKAGIIFTISNVISNGHLYVELKKLKTKAIALLELEDNPEIIQKLKITLHDLYNIGKIKLVSPAENEHYITLSQYYFSEKGVAHKLQKLIELPVNYTFNFDAIYKSLHILSRLDNIALNKDQQSGIIASLQNKVTVITGGPGTGKTTLIKKLLNILDDYKLNYKLAAPTGRAAKRITESTGHNALTIHRLLEFDMRTMGFTHNEQNMLQLDFLIVDESSMIDIFLAYALLKALPLHAHVLFIGDIDQLPSVGAGNFLHDIIRSKVITNIRLIQIFRQAQDSLIVTNAYRINKGEFPSSYLPNSRHDFIYIKEEKPDNMQHHLHNIYTNGLKKYGISTQNSIVLTPMNRGAIGTQNINHYLQKILNPIQTEKQVMRTGIVFKIYDRVMQIRNNYDKNVFNGDIGIIEDIDMQEQTMFIRYFERIVEYNFGELDELVLSYAITIHKSQGSEYAAVIVPIFMQHFTLLQRNLIYTAITRAKKLCIFIGQPKAIGMAINNTKGRERKTFLSTFLTSDLQCR